MHTILHALFYDAEKALVSVDEEAGMPLDTFLALRQTCREWREEADSNLGRLHLNLMQYAHAVELERVAERTLSSWAHGWRTFHFEHKLLRILDGCQGLILPDYAVDTYYYLRPQAHYRYITLIDAGDDPIDYDIEDKLEDLINTGAVFSRARVCFNTFRDYDTPPGNIDFDYELSVRSRAIFRQVCAVMRNQQVELVQLDFPAYYRRRDLYMDCCALVRLARLWEDHPIPGVRAEFLFSMIPFLGRWQNTEVYEQACETLAAMGGYQPLLHLSLEAMATADSLTGIHECCRVAGGFPSTSTCMRVLFAREQIATGSLSWMYTSGGALHTSPPTFPICTPNSVTYQAAVPILKRHEHPRQALVKTIAYREGEGMCENTSVRDLDELDMELYPCITLQIERRKTQASEGVF